MVWSQRMGKYCLFVAASCCLLLSAAAAQISHPSEVNALRAVLRDLKDPFKYLRNWNKGDPCTSNWVGVLCYNTVASDGYLHVRELQLLNLNLSGTLAPEIGQLSQLQILDFMWNGLSGSIPKEIGYISSLKLLLLNGNKLSGPLPDELGYLSNLNRLQVDENNISGQLPMSFSNLSSLQHLHLNNNSISGQIPPELSKLSTLIHLLLDNNNLSGYLPSEFSNFPDLRILQLDNNNFSGSEVPASYGKFSKLAKLSLRNCGLQGGVPDFSGISSLYYLDLSGNSLTGTIPSNKLSANMSTIDLSDNYLNGSIPDNFSDLPSLQKLSLENNFLTGGVPVSIWKNLKFSTNATFMLDLRNNKLSSIAGDLNPPANVTLRLDGNPICRSANIPNINLFCRSESANDAMAANLAQMTCAAQACPADDFFEYVPASPEPCFCAAPLRIGYRLKSPSFYSFPPYILPFETYLTHALNLDPYEVVIGSYTWEAGPRLRMYLKLFPKISNQSHEFNKSEVQRIRGIFTSWRFPGSDFFGPYELLNFTLLGPYANADIEVQRKAIPKRILAAIVLVAVLCTVVISAIISSFIIRRRTQYQRALSRKRLSSRASMKIDGVKDFTFKEVAGATDNFNTSTQVGRGGYGKVYRGILSDGSVVAIKRAEEDSLQGQKEFLTEIKLLSRLHHRNLVSLIGYCDEEGEQMLIYEFMPNGTLRDWLSGRAKDTLNFHMRICIALGSAKGLLYLHTEADPPVFHRDIKASNILLDSKLNAKVADFGLSRLAPVLDDDGIMPNHVSTVVKGTPGYLDPEYFLTHKLTDKSDVYSLGVVFLELLTGMQPISHGKNIVREVNRAHQSGMMFSVIDTRMGSYASECIERFVTLSLSCCHDKPEKRPSMLDVVRELEYILKTMPDTDAVTSVHVSDFSGKTSSSASSSYTGKDHSASSVNLDVSGSDLLSGAMPTIAPR